MEKTKVDIQGMHCKSCEMLIEDELLKIPAVSSVEVNQKKGCAFICHQGKLNMHEVSDAVKEAGYSLGKDIKPFFSRNSDDYLDLSIAGLIVFILAAFVYINGLTEFGTSTLTDYSSLPIVFLIGLTAGISTCMALIGGLVLGVAARFAESHPTATAMEKFTPHVFFNLGRILSFFIFGGIIGYAGSFFTFSSTTLGILIVVVGIVMFFLGLQIIEIFPKLSGMTFTLPKGLTNLLGLKQHSGKEYSHKNAVLLGGMTFFLPCGFTQAMQLFAMSTGDPVAGSLTMGVFALGTTPGLLSIGGLTAIVKGAFARIFFKFAGIVVLVLALYNISSGLTLSGLTNPGVMMQLPQSADASDTLQQTADVQVLSATYSPAAGMQPADFTIKAGVPARLEIDALENGAGCMGSVTLPGLASNVEVFTQGKKTVFDFTAPAAGTFTIACAMGIPHGYIKAI